MSIFKKILGGIGKKKTRGRNEDVEYLDEEDLEEDSDQGEDLERGEGVRDELDGEEYENTSVSGLNEGTITDRKERGSEKSGSEENEFKKYFDSTEDDIENDEDEEEVKINYRNDLLNSSGRNKEEMYEAIRRKTTDAELNLISQLMKESVTTFDIYRKAEENNINLMIFVAYGMIMEEDLVGYRAYQKKGLDTNDHMTAEEMITSSNKSYEDEVLNGAINLQVIEEKNKRKEEFKNIEREKEEKTIIEDVSDKFTQEKEEKDVKVDEYISKEKKEDDDLWGDIPDKDDNKDQGTVLEVEPEDKEKIEKTEDLDVVEDKSDDQLVTVETKKTSAVGSGLSMFKNLLMSKEDNNIDDTLTSTEEMNVLKEKDISIEEVGKGESEKGSKNLDVVLYGEKELDIERRTTKESIVRDINRNVYVICEGLDLPEMEGYTLISIKEMSGVFMYSALKANLLVITSKIPEILLEDMGDWLQGIVADEDKRRIVTLKGFEVKHPNIEREIELTKEDLDSYYKDFTDDKYNNAVKRTFMDIDKLLKR